MEKTIGMRIKECRMKLGMTQEDLADAMFVPKTTISSYERDAVDMKIFEYDLKDAVLEGIRRRTASGQPLSADIDGRVVIR